MTFHPLWEPVPDGSRAGRVIEGGTRHQAAVATDGREWTWRDRNSDAGRVLAGYGAVGMDLSEVGDDFHEATVSHVLDPDEAEKLAMRLMVAATLARRLKR